MIDFEDLIHALKVRQNLEEIKSALEQFFLKGERGILGEELPPEKKGILGWKYLIFRIDCESLYRDTERKVFVDLRDDLPTTKKYFEDHYGFEMGHFFETQRSFVAKNVEVAVALTDAVRRFFGFLGQEIIEPETRKILAEKDRAGRILPMFDKREPLFLIFTLPEGGNNKQ